MPRGRLRIPRSAIAQRGFAQYAREVRERARNLHPAWDAVRAIIFASTADRFTKEGRRGGFRKWRALSRKPSNWLGGLSYREWKDENFPGQPILQLTGRMAYQLTGLSGDHYEERSSQHLTIGSNLPVDSGEGHDLGGIHAVGRQTHPAMPARPPFGISITDANDITNVLVDYVTGTSRD